MSRAPRRPGPRPADVAGFEILLRLARETPTPRQPLELERWMTQVRLKVLELKKRGPMPRRRELQTIEQAFALAEELVFRIREAGRPPGQHPSATRADGER